MSMTNKVRVLRGETSRSSRKGTRGEGRRTSQQIARIEAGRQICRIDLAARIGVPPWVRPSTVFPQTMKALGKVKAKPGPFLAV